MIFLKKDSDVRKIIIEDPDLTKDIIRALTGIDSFNKLSGKEIVSICKDNEFLILNLLFKNIDDNLSKINIFFSLANKQEVKGGLASLIRNNSDKKDLKTMIESALPKHRHFLLPETFAEINITESLEDELQRALRKATGATPRTTTSPTAAAATDNHNLNNGRHN